MAIELESMKYFQTAQTQEGEGDGAATSVLDEMSALETQQQQEVRANYHAAPTVRSGWTKGLSWIVGFFAFICVTGLISAAFGVLGLMIEPMTTDTSGMTYNQKQQIEQIETTVAESRGKFLIAHGYLELMKLGLAIGFGVAAFYLVTRNSRGRSLAVAVCVLALLFHVSQTGVGVMVATSGGLMTDVINISIGEAASEQGLSAEETANLKSGMDNAVFTGMLIAISIGLVVKFAFYGLIMMHLMQPEVKRIFGDDELSRQSQVLEVPAVA